MRDDGDTMPDAGFFFFFFFFSLKCHGPLQCSKTFIMSWKIPQQDCGNVTTCTLRELAAQAILFSTVIKLRRLMEILMVPR